MKIKPSFPEFKEMTQRGNLIPVYQEILADLETPVSAYLKIRDSSFSYLLESADRGERWGRYSFIGYRPDLTVISRNGDMEIIRNSGKEIHRDVENPMEVLRAVNAQLLPVPAKDLPPFQGGLVGYVNYDLIRKWERLPGIKPQKDVPELIFAGCRRMIVFDHLTHQIMVIAFAHLQNGWDAREAYNRASQEVGETLRDLQCPLSMGAMDNAFSVTKLESNFQKEEFEEAVLKAKEYIASGDVIQVVLSQRFSGEVSGEDFLLYRNLRSVNPSPYMFYLNFGETKIIGASPEILVRLTSDRIELRPIAGTRPRGESQEADRDLEGELMADPKERAEHIMLVDLGRNDVGKVATPGSVSVPRLMEVERYSHVMHIVSRIEGKLKQGRDCFDLFMSAFPAGTVSGAPKIRAMEIIGELEPTARGPYAGAVGYFGFNGNMDFCITIRTITVYKNKLSIQVGAGIVADSSPENEYEETLKKGAAMFRAIDKVKGGERP